jgi:hypothetical protein
MCAHPLSGRKRIGDRKSSPPAAMRERVKPRAVGGKIFGSLSIGWVA